MARPPAARASSAGRRGGVAGTRARIRALPGGRVAWRIAVTLAGAVIIALGILLLPLPGPGWLILFAGLGVLGTEYAWARRLLTWVRTRLRQWTQWVAARALWLRLLAGVLSLIVLGAVAATAWLLTW